MEDISYKKILKVDKSIMNFCIEKNKTVADAIQAFFASKGLPLIVINASYELIGSLSNGDIRKFLSDPKSKITDPISKALNRSPHYAFDTDDISVVKHELSTEKTRLVPIITKNRKVISIAYLTDISLNINQKDITYQNNLIYLIAEIGVNHNGNLKEAYELVDAAVEANFDAVKLQFRSNSTYSNVKETGNIDLGTEYILEELKRTSLNSEEEKKLCRYIRSKQIDFIGTPFDDDALERLYSYQPDAIKIASCDLTNHSLLKNCANKNLPLIISTGMSNETEIIQTKQYLTELEVDHAFLHCNSTYPSPVEDARLKYIGRLAYITNAISGYSSHDGNKYIPLAAIGAGAKIIELHITKDKKAKGTDHAASLVIDELKSFVKSARLIAKALGSSNPRVPTQGELINKVSLGKSLCYKRNLKKGTIINTEKDFILRSPGDGITSTRLNEFINKKLTKDVNYLDKVDFTDFENLVNLSTNIRKELQDDQRKSLSQFEWGVPVRYRDMEEMISLFKPPLIEIHLSSKDLGFPLENLNHKYMKNKSIILHAIEQYHDGFILDLASNRQDIIDESFLRINELNEHAKKINTLFQPKQKIKIVMNCGGFSRTNFLNKEEVQQREVLLIDNLILAKNKLSEFEILPQSMPPFPWHQGGRSYHNLLRSTESLISLNQQTGLNICLDFSHTYMDCLYTKCDFYQALESLMPITSHLHISDSNSSSNEGLNIDEGSIDFENVFNIILNKDFSKRTISLIPEVWQGHHNNGEGFQIALERMSRYISEQVS
ncbi:N-acetylneuraminate synthase family protein [Prochlorococcus sp. MIT 1307]|uniref:N-acetylneuraminate synthase family protein n=1 Tax=Prochlorococcus sp. MIT 1307 TaxID=3096219 RepID=UPI002A75A577|nr:N-acetylneuraminate synthase family protein [Prochlorococcus sp. MIT 1307]